MSEQRVGLLRKGLIGTCAFVTLVLLVAFYSTVSGAVERAARQRVAALDSTAQATKQPAQRQAQRGHALLARVDN